MRIHHIPNYDPTSFLQSNSDPLTPFNHQTTHLMLSFHSEISSSSRDHDSTTTETVVVAKTYNLLLGRFT